LNTLTAIDLVHSVTDTQINNFETGSSLEEETLNNSNFMFGALWKSILASSENYIFPQEINFFDILKSVNQLSGYNNLINSKYYVLLGKPTSIYEEIKDDDFKKFYETFRLCQEEEKINKNKIFYSIIDKSIYNDWYEFAHDLLPGLREFTPDEQDKWNAMIEDISEIVEI
jgi:hypothetical protein